MSNFDVDRIRSFLVTENIKSIKNALDAIDTGKLEKRIEKQIKIRTRLGKDKDGKDFKELKKNTIKIREAARENKKLSKETLPARSNQTFTGQMVNAVLISIEKTKNSIKFFGGLKSSRDDGKDNRLVYMYNVIRGRDFYGITKAEEKMIGRLIREMWKKYFDKK